MATPTPQELRDFINNRFNLSELSDLCFGPFAKVYSELEGSGKTRSEYSLFLVSFCQRNDLIEKLIEELDKARPEQFRAAFPHYRLLPKVVPSKTHPARPQNPKRVFVSHSSKDTDFAHRLASDLLSNGFDVWIAPDSIRDDEDFVDAIGRGLGESGIFLSILTPDAVESEWVRRETSIAINREIQKKIKFVLLKHKACDAGDLNALLESKQYISFENSYALDRLLAALRGTPMPSPRPSQD